MGESILFYGKPSSRILDLIHERKKMRKMNLKMIQWLDIHSDIESNHIKVQKSFEKKFELSRDEADVMIHAWERIEDHRDWGDIDFTGKIGFPVNGGR